MQYMYVPILVLLYILFLFHCSELVSEYRSLSREKRELAGRLSGARYSHTLGAHATQPHTHTADNTAVLHIIILGLAPHCFLHHNYATCT